MLERRPDATVKLTSLVDLELTSCIMCGNCQEEWNCIYDEDYNVLLQDVREADAIFFVIPYYAPIPSKMSIVLEKIQEMCFIQMCVNKTVPFFLKNKVAGLVVHGGSSKEYLSTYKSNLLDPVSSALKGVGMRLMGVGAEWPNGVSFGVTGFEPQEGTIFPRATHDWDEVRVNIAVLVNEVVCALRDNERA